MAKPPRTKLSSILIAVPIALASVDIACAQDLTGFAVISGQSISNTGPTTIGGDIALYPGTSYTGSGSVTQTGSAYLSDAVAGRIQSELVTLYNILAGRPTSAGGNLTGLDLGGRTLSSGVYNFDTTAGLAAGQTLTLDGGGNPDAVFIFNIGSSFTAGSGSAILLQNGAQGGNVFFRIGSSATLDTSADLLGQIVALTSITLNTAATIDCGAAFARNGSITLDTNTINICVLAGPDLGTDVDTTGFTANELSVFDALADYTADGGVLPLSLGILIATQTSDELAASMRQLGGLVATGLAPAVMQSMDGFLDTTLSSIPARMASLGPTDEDVPVGLVREKINTPYTGKYDTPAASIAPLIDPAVTRGWSVWASAYGGSSVTDGDQATGSSDLSITNRGLAAGLNYQVGERSDVGISIGFGTGDFSLQDDQGSGSSEFVQFAIHGRTSWDRAYVLGALAFGRADVDTARTLTIGGVDRLIGETTAKSIAARIEAGYQMGRFTPFVGLLTQSVETLAFSETAESGNSTYALQYDANTLNSVRSELGVMVHWPANPARSGAPSFGIRAAWQHEFATNDAASHSLLLLPDVAFPVTGAAPDRDSLVLQANVTLAADHGFYMNGLVSQEIGSNLRDLSGSLKVGYTW